MIKRSENIRFDLVIPLFNEQRSLPLLFKVLDQVFSEENCREYGLTSVRYVFVDDGSTDSSPDLIQGYIRGKTASLIQLSRNFGHQSALSAGLQQTTGDVVGVMDADLQDPPEIFFQMLQKWREGHDVVYGQRKKRQEFWPRVFLTWAFYRIYRLLSPVAVPLDSGDFCLMSRRIVDEMNRLSESLRFPRGLRTWLGFSQVAVPYERPKRAAGESKYTLRDLYQLATTGITALSIRPLQLAQSLAVLYMFASFILFCVIAVRGVSAIGLDRPSFILLIFGLFSNSLVMFCFYILGAYVGRGYLETKGRPAFIVKDKIEGETGEPA